MFFKIGVLKNFANIQRKTPVLESLFNKVAGLQLSCEYCEIFKNGIFHETTSVVASEKFMNFPGKHQRRRRNRFIFLINMTRIADYAVDISRFYIT